MRLKKIDENTLTLEVKQIRWVRFLLFCILIVCAFVARDAFTDDLSAWSVGACLVALLTWLGFARISTDSIAVIDLRLSKFSFSSRSYFGGVTEEYSCDLGRPFDVLLEEEGSTTYRIGFETKDGIKYVSKIFSNDSARRKFATIRQHLSRDAA